MRVEILPIPFRVRLAANIALWRGKIDKSTRLIDPYVKVTDV